MIRLHAQDLLQEPLVKFKNKVGYDSVAYSM